jgi:hypothetical protein
MMNSTIITSIQVYNVKMTSSKNCKVQKQMAKCGFGRKFHDHKYFIHGFF